MISLNSSPNWLFVYSSPTKTAKYTVTYVFAAGFSKFLESFENKMWD